jgi:hypothetical protein
MIAEKIGVTSLIVYRGEEVGGGTLGDVDEIDEEREEEAVAADEKEDRSTADENDVVDVAVDVGDADDVVVDSDDAVDDGDRVVVELSVAVGCRCCQERVC